MATTISNQPPSVTIPELRGPALSITAGGLAGASVISMGTLAYNGINAGSYAAAPSTWSRVGSNGARGLVLGAVALADFEVIRNIRPGDDAWVDAGRGALIGAGIGASNALAVSVAADMSQFTSQTARGRVGAVALTAGIGALAGALALGGWSAATRS